MVLVGDLNTDDEIVETLGDTPGTLADELPYAVLTTDPDGPGSRGTAVPFEERSFDGPASTTRARCCFHDRDDRRDPADTFDHTVDHIMVSDDDPGGQPNSPTDPNTNDIALVNSDR